MIRINLLPEEMRRSEGTPLPRRLAIFAGTALIALLAMAWVTVHFQTIPEREASIKARTRERNDLQARVDADVVPLDQYLAATKTRQKIAEELRASRPLWAPVLDALWTTISSSEGAWLEDLGLTADDLEVESLVNPRKKTKVPQQSVRMLCVATLLGVAPWDLDRVAKARIAQIYDRMVADIAPIRQDDLLYYDFGIGTWEVTEAYSGSVGGRALRFELFLRVRMKKAYDEALAVK
ncbi:MAG: hypothetical protein HY608_07815 [Planctomycetes bacterium]|nr:hypothetical protein [Planctomycetota bacterium]